MRENVAGCRKSLPKMCERYLCRGACSGRSRDGLGRGPIVTATRRFRKVRISWQAQHFGEPRYRCRGRRNTFARPSIDFAQGGACRFRGTRSTFARSGADFNTFAWSSTDFVAGAALSHGQVQISWQAILSRWQAQFFVIKCTIPLFRRRETFARSRTVQHFRKVRNRFGGRRSTFARLGTDFVAGTILSQGHVQISWQAQNFVIEGTITLFQLQLRKNFVQQ